VKIDRTGGFCEANVFEVSEGRLDWGAKGKVAGSGVTKEGEKSQSHGGGVQLRTVEEGSDFGRL